MSTRELALLKTFKSIKDNFKISARIVDIDNLAFKLHYRVTAILLLACAAMITTFHYFGGHIDCVSDKGVADKVINSFCFFSTTFTVVKHLNRNSVSAGVAVYPGVGPIDQEKDHIVRHAYYQWVPFVLFAQAILFYLPHFAWKQLEGGTIAGFIRGLEHCELCLGEKDLKLRKAVVPSKKHRDERVASLSKAFVERRPFLGRWARDMVACELMCAVNLTLQALVLHKFLGGHFWDLVPGALDADAEIPRLDVIFPKITKCTFYKYGSSGSIQKHDALCVMPLNLINEKVFVVLWVWLTALLLATVAGVAWRVATVLLHGRVVSKVMIKVTYPGRMDDRAIDSALAACDFPAWLFLCYLGQNIDAFTFKDVVHAVAGEVDADYHDDMLASQDTLPLNKERSSCPELFGPLQTHEPAPETDSQDEDQV